MGNMEITRDLLPTIEANEEIQRTALSYGLELGEDGCQNAENTFQSDAGFGNDELIYDPCQRVCHWTIFDGSSLMTAETLVETAYELTSAGLFAEAAATANMIEDSVLRADTLDYIAYEMRTACLVDQAAEEEKDTRIAMEMANAGSFDEAVEVAEDGPRRDEILLHTAMEMAKAGLFDSAIETANKSGYQDHALHNIAHRMAKAGLFDRALETANMIEDALLKASALEDVTCRMIGETELKGKYVKLLDHAVKEANKIKDDEDRAVALHCLANAMANVGLFDRAVKTANMIDLPSCKNSALCDIAWEMAKARLFDKALLTVDMIEDASLKEEALKYTAVFMAKAGLFDRAVETANMLEDAANKEKALEYIGSCIAIHGTAPCPPMVEQIYP